MRSTKWTLAIAALLLLSAAPLKAQEKPANGREDTVTSQRAAKPSATGIESTDQTVASCLTISNQEEVALAKLAVSHAENPKVKQLAEALIKDHQECLGELKAFSGAPVALRTPSDDSARKQDSASEVTREAETQRTAARDLDGLNFLDIKRKMAEKCVQSAEKQWNAHRGAEGDQCFVGTQIVMHQQMIDAQEVLMQYASPKLQTFIEKSLDGTKMHLAHAETLMKELAHNSETQKTNN